MNRCICICLQHGMKACLCSSPAPSQLTSQLHVSCSSDGPLQTDVCFVFLGLRSHTALILFLWPVLSCFRPLRVASRQHSVSHFKTMQTSKILCRKKVDNEITQIHHQERLVDNIWSPPCVCIRGCDCCNRHLSIACHVYWITLGSTDNIWRDGAIEDLWLGLQTAYICILAEVDRWLDVWHRLESTCHVVGILGAAKVFCGLEPFYITMATLNCDQLISKEIFIK